MLEARVTAQEERMSGVVAVVVLCVLLWGILECLWERFFGNEGGVKLEGDERRLTADVGGEGGEEERNGHDEKRHMSEEDWRGSGGGKEVLRAEVDLKESVWGP
jgi:hypothetical protein